MSFASSSSAFGMKPATGTANIFGQPQQQAGQQQQPSLFSSFGQNQQQNQPQQPANAFSQPQPQQTTGENAFGQSQQTTGGLFGQPQQQPQQTTGGLFGQSQQQPQPTSGGIFGSQTQPQQTTGGLFGSTQTQPQQNTGGLFGSNIQTQPTAGGLFGSTTQAQPNAGGLFGSTTQSQPTAGGLFGQTQPRPQQTNNPLFGGGGGSLFGGQQQQQQQQQTGLFGSNTTTPSNPLQPQATLPASAFGTSTATGTGAPGGGFGGSTLFGNKQPQQQQPSLFGSANQNFAQQNPLTPSTAAGPAPFTKSTKFNDLPDNLKSILESMDSHIQGRIQICKDLQQRKLGDEPTKGHEAIRNIQKDLVNTSATIRNDLNVTQDIKAKVDQAVEDTIVATRIIDGFRNPQSGNTYLKDHAGFPLEYFTRITEEMKQRLEWYKSTIEQIERKLASATSTTQTPQSIAATLQAQHATFITLASKTAAVDAELQKIKVLYIQLWRAKTGSVRDPFGDVVKSNDKNGDFGLSQLNVR